VTSHLLSVPAFGEADLSNCEREQIHLAGSIQPHGALLVVREPEQIVVQASDNAATFLGLEGDLLGRPLDQLEGDLAERIRPYLGGSLQTIPTAVRCRFGRHGAVFDGLLHRLPESGLVIELERAGPAVDLNRHVEKALATIFAGASLRNLAEDVADIFKDLTGYDRVMVYRFDDQGHGEVFAERHEPGLESFLGNRYPASDIPQIARRLYERNRIRVLVDVGFEPVPINPPRSPIDGRELDMSLCILRSPSPIHVQYLKNMGVAATLVVSLMVGGRLWGLISCHHYGSRFVHYEVRAVAELLAETIGTRITALESFVQAQAELSVRRLEQRMIEAITRDGDWRSALFDSPQSLLKPLDATGAALLFEGQILTIGEVPGTQELRDIAAWLDQRGRAPVIATATLALDAPRFAHLAPVASGLLAAPVSSGGGEYLIWFRPERVRTVTWGGNPFKPVVVGEDPADLSPRRSFSKWHQLVEQTSEVWSQPDLTAARLIGETVADVVLQFRAVRTLIVQDQLEQFGRQVRHSDQPVIIADAAGRILLSNRAFERLVNGGDAALATLDDLPKLFSDPAAVAPRLRDVRRSRRIWRGEVQMVGEDGSLRPLLVRADPVLASAERVLGFVLLFTDLSGRKEAEAARRRFREGAIERHPVMSVPLDSKADLIYRNLLSEVVGNAQLAALEVTDGEDLQRMPEMLDSIRASVARTAELLEHLIEHASLGEEDDSPDRS
jgi:chemotaxis family two-component system sensor kinase Cph1